MTTPALNFTITGPYVALATELTRLQRRAVETEVARLTPLLQNRWS